MTFSGAGIAAMASSPANIADVKSKLKWSTIGFDKINQIRHVRYFRTAENMREHMKLLASVIRPKLEIVQKVLKEEIGDTGAAHWNNPRGGYFVSLYTMDGCAMRAFELAAEAGVKMTAAGSAYPYHKDDHDSHIRIAPTYPSDEELLIAMHVFSVCVKLAALEKVMDKSQK